jgi:hypothetical protein
MLQGTHDGTGFDGTDQNGKLEDFVYEMEQWVIGVEELLNVQTHTTFTNSFGTGYRVKCFDWTWSRSAADPNRIVYTLLMHEV